MGPPASGKSSAFNIWYNHQYKVDHGIPKADFIEINVDNIVASDTNYIESMKGVRELLAKEKDLLSGKNKIKSHPSLIGSNDVDTRVYKTVNDACTLSSVYYSQFRVEADKKSEELLELHLQNPTKCIVYETTGGSESAYDWMLKVAKRAKDSGYVVHLVYPIVDLESIKNRMVARALTSTDGRLPCPAIVEVSHRESRKYLLKIIETCQPNNVWEQSCIFDSISVIDNHKLSPLLIFRIGREPELNVPLGNITEDDDKFLYGASAARTPCSQSFSEHAWLVATIFVPILLFALLCTVIHLFFVRSQLDSANRKLASQSL